MKKIDTGIVRDSYSEFINYFNISKEDFYLFGIRKTIYADIEDAKKQWLQIKESLTSNQPLSIRKYGQQGKNSYLYVDMYKSIFENSNIITDPTNNSFPRDTLANSTSNIINRTLFNYQCSHIFGRTKNPLLFTSLWNLCFTPKLFDPLTGHETKGVWPTEYQRLFKEFAYKRFEPLIDDFNIFVEEENVIRKINTYIDSLYKKHEEKTLERLRKQAVSEWEKITL